MTVGGATALTTATAGRNRDEGPPFNAPYPRPAITDPDLFAAFNAARDAWEKRQEQLTLDWDSTSMKETELR